jgi:hypothetical protein
MNSLGVKKIGKTMRFFSKNQMRQAKLNARRRAERNVTRKQKRAMVQAAIQNNGPVLGAINEKKLYEDEDYPYEIVNKFCKFVKRLQIMEEKEYAKPDPNQDILNKIAMFKQDMAEMIINNYRREAPVMAALVENIGMNAPAPARNNLEFNDELAKLMKGLTFT